MKKRSGGRTALIILCVVLGLVLTVMAGGTLYANHLMGLMNRLESGNEETLSQEQLNDMLSKETEPTMESQGAVVNEDEIDWGNEDVEKIPASENIINILLIGQDYNAGGGRSRSDSMILVTFNHAKKTITMTSFLRDLYVKIPGYWDNKLNVPYPAGGVELLNEVLELNFGVQVDGNVIVDFSQFPEVIDLLGGVDMEVRSDEAAYINKHTKRNELSEGMMHLDGEQALYYSRIRHLDSDADFSRTNRQRKVLNSLIEKFRNTKLTTLLGLLDEILPMITTDMENDEIIGYAKDLFPLLSECTIVSQRIPADGAYYLGMVREMSVVIADMDAARQLLAETLKD